MHNCDTRTTSEGTIMKRSIFFLVTAVVSLHAQTELFGVRAYANNDEYRLPVITAAEQITIEFDVTTDLPPNLNIIFRHANRDWVVDRNTFVNYEPKLRSESLVYTRAPDGAYHYTYHFKNSFPNRMNFVSFPYSGNYLYSIVDRDNGDKVLANGKFIVAERTVPAGLRIENTYHPGYASPMNQMLSVAVSVDAPVDYTAADESSIDHSEIKRVDIIKNWELENPLRIDLDDRSPETFVENFIKANKNFRKRDVSPGNEYRRLDLSSVSLYPNNAPVKLRDQPDLSRFQWLGKPDANGAAKLNTFTGANSDYLEVEMRLRLTEQAKRRIYLVGGFTEWKVLPEYEMVLDSTGLYTCRFWVRRGVYDYQYVLGEPDGRGEVTEQDWVSLEGNDWRSINRYTALIYYFDRRLGGFDRVVGFVRGRNSGRTDNGAFRTFTYPDPGPAPQVNSSNNVKY